MNITVLSVAEWLAVPFLASVLITHTNALRFLLLLAGACTVAVVALVAVVTIVQVLEERMERLRQSTRKEAVADRQGDPRLQIWPYAVDIVCMYREAVVLLDARHRSRA